MRTLQIQIPDFVSIDLREIHLESDRLKYTILKSIGIIFMKFIGVIFSLHGLLGVLVSIVAIIDPVGTQLANDSDPFGVPPTQTESLQILAGYWATIYN